MPTANTGFLQSSRRLRLSRATKKPLDTHRPSHYIRNAKLSNSTQGEQECESAQLNLQRPDLLAAIELFRPTPKLVGSLQRYVRWVCHRHRISFDVLMCVNPTAITLYFSSAAGPDSLPRAKHLQRTDMGPQRCSAGLLHQSCLQLTSSTGPSISANIDLGQDRLRPIDYSDPAAGR